MADIVKMRSKLQDVPFVKMRVAAEAQRVLRPPHFNKIIGEFDPEFLGYPVVSLRDGHFYIIDGQHRVEACKIWIGEGWETQAITCRVYTGMTLKDEADMFDHLNLQLNVAAFDKFRARCTAERTDELAVYRVVEKSGLTVSGNRHQNGVTAVSTLLRVYRRSDAATLARTLKIVHNAFGDPGLTTAMIDGVAMVCERYNGSIDDRQAIDRLSSMRGGVGALMTRATTLRKQTGKSVPVCVAAATVDVLNASKGGKKIPSWWKQQ